LPQLYSNHHANVKFVASNEQEWLIQTRKRNNSTRFHYYDLARNNAHKQKQLITFTYSDSDARFKMQVINEMRNYFNKLVRNLQTDSIKHFSNIEIGQNFDNPHLHIQVWYEESDSFALERIYNKVIQRYGLMTNRCSQVANRDDTEVFHYVIKDYRKDISDEELIKLNSHKAWYRKELGKNLRFSSHSKSKYTKVIYKRGFALGILKNDVDFLLDHEIVDESFNIIDEEVALWMVMCVFSSLLGQENNKWIRYLFHRCLTVVSLPKDFEWWIFGFVDRLMHYNSPDNINKRIRNVYLVNFPEDRLEHLVSVYTEYKTTANYASNAVSNPKAWLCCGACLEGRPPLRNRY
jgi:hypothetical protein